MNKILYTICILIASVLSLSAQDLPKYDAEFNYIKKEYKWNNDGSVDYSCHKEIKLNTHYAFHSLYGETFVIYNPNFQSFTINEAYTIMKDGKKVMLPKNAVNEVLPKFAKDAPAYNDLREVVITHTGLEIGATIYFDYTIHSNKGYYNALQEYIQLGERVPVKKMDIIVKLPHGHSFNHKTLNLRYSASYQPTKAYDMYVWNLNGLSPLPYTNEFQKTFYPAVIFNSSESLLSLSNELTMNDNFTYELDKKLKDKLAPKSMHSMTLMEQIRSIQEILVKDVKTYPIPMEYTGYKYRNPIDIYQSAGGTPLEKALLLTAMYKEAGISADVVYAIPNPAFDEKASNFDESNGFYVMVTARDEGVFILSTDHLNSTNDKYLLEDYKVFKVMPKLERFVFSDINKNDPLVKVRSSLIINSVDNRYNINGEIDLSLNQSSNPYLDYFRSNHKPFFIKNAKVDSEDIKRNNTDESLLKIKCSESSSSFNYLDGGIIQFNLPVVNQGIEHSHLPALVSKVEYPVILNQTYNEDYKFEIKIKGDKKKLMNPIEMKISNSIGDIHIQIAQKKGKVLVTRKLNIKHKYIQPHEYKDFKELISLWKTSKYRSIFLK
ncbi:MAG: DUF3857 domain-containing protein [Hyphomicrobiales bacterium]